MLILFSLILSVFLLVELHTFHLIHLIPQEFVGICGKQKILSIKIASLSPVCWIMMLHPCSFDFI